MIDVSVQVDDSVLAFIRDSANNSPKLLQTALKRTLRGQKRTILKRLETEPGAVAYPIKWKSARQRRAFFATNGFGRGIPTVRTHAVIDSYDLLVETTDAGGGVYITNSAAEAPYVIGDDIQPFHIITGWQPIEIAAVDAAAQVEAALIQTWLTVTDPTAGVRDT